MKRRFYEHTQEKKLQVESYDLQTIVFSGQEIYSCFC